MLNSQTIQKRKHHYYLLRYAHRYRHQITIQDKIIRDSDGQNEKNRCQKA
jgi:hypothetical protein